MAQISFGRLLAERRRQRQLTQEDVASVLGMTRSNYSMIESGKRKELLDPDRAIRLSRLLQIEMLDLVIAMGYPVRCPGQPDNDEMEFLDHFRRLTPAQQRVLRAAVGLGSPSGL